MPERTYDDAPCNGDGSCRHCDERARWSTWCGRGWTDLCDRHFGISLRKTAKLRRLTFKTAEPVVTAQVGR